MNSSSRAADRPSCKHGHPYPQNLRSARNGHVYCATCDSIRGRKYRRRNYMPVEPDAIAIERAVAGAPPARLTPRERAAAVLALTERGLAAWRIAEQVGCSKRTVHRVRGRYATAA